MKMKKSLLIVPAMATMLLAAAGSVGGTVAWFSANTTFDTTAGQFAVAALDGNLSCDLAPGVGTEIAGDAPVIRVPSGNYLADASYDHANRTVWTDTNANTEGNATAFVEKTQLAADSVATSVPALEAASLPNSKTLYWAVTWKMTFKFVMSAAATTTNLYFDPTGTASADEQEGIAEATKKTRNGFRIAWTELTTTTENCTGNDRVWAPFHTETTPSAFFYVAGATGATGAKTAYDATNLMLPADTTNHVQSTAANGSSTAVNCLGQFVGAANAEVKIDFVCTAWYEGNDSDVVNAASKDVVNNLALHFFTLPNA